MSHAARFALTLSVLVSGLCIHAPAQAQEGPQQTVENAQKFLSIVLPKKSYVAGSLKATIQRVASMKQVDASLYGSGTVTDASAVSRCVSRILFDNSNVNVSIMMNGQQQIVPLAQINAAALKGGIPEGFHWGDVLFVKQEGAAVHFRLNGTLDSSEIYLGGESLATRVAYAMEFLRISCDKAADTGF